MDNNTNLNESVNNYQGDNVSDEIDLKDIFLQLWVKRWFIIKIILVFFLIGIFIALFSPVKYTADCTIVPQSGKGGSGGNLGGIATMMGVNIGNLNTTGETLSPSIYPQIIESTPFTREIMQTPVRVEKSEGVDITLYDYYTNKQYQPFNLIGIIKKYTIGLPGVILGTIRKSDVKKEKLIPVDTTSLLILNNKENQVYQNIQSSIKLELKQKEGYIIISYTFSEARAAAQIVDQIRKTLENYVTGFKTEKAKENLLFVEENFNEAREVFLDKQESLASFQDANRALTTASARATEQRLRSEYDIAFTVYSELARQLEQARLTVKESKPLFTIIDPVVVPLKKSAPRRSVIIISYILLGFVIGIGWVIFKPFISHMIQSAKQEEKNRLLNA